VSLPDRIDPRPPRRIYRWDLDKTYLRTDFDNWRQLVRTAFEKAHDKVAVPGAPALIRELRAAGDCQVFIVSGSPKQMRSVLEEKLKLDGVQWDEMILKDNVRNLLRGRFRALRGQIGYKLPILLESRARAPYSEAEEICFGDDAEADAFIYSLFGDMVARRVDEEVVRKVLEAAQVYPDETRRVMTAWKKTAIADPVRRIFIHLDRLTPPARFARYGPRVVPVFNYFQAALVLMADGLLTAPQVVKVALEMVQTAGYNLLTLSNSFQDLLRRGLPLHEIIQPLIQALEGGILSGPQGVLAALRPVPDIVAAFTKRLAVLGAAPPPPRVVHVDYLGLIDDAMPRHIKGKPAPEPKKPKKGKKGDEETGAEALSDEEAEAEAEAQEEALGPREQAALEAELEEASDEAAEEAEEDAIAPKPKAKAKASKGGKADDEESP